MAYSEGLLLMDRRHRAMPNGLLNDNSVLGDWISFISQRVALVPAPADDDHFYAFYWQDGGRSARGKQLYRLTYARADQRLRNGDGDVVEKGMALASTETPQLTAVRHANNRDFWVLMRDEEGRGFRAFLLDRQGVHTIPVLSLAGETLPSGHVELKAAPNGRRLASSARVGPELLALCVFDFDNGSGVVAREQVIEKTIYGASSLSFSPNSQLLYVTNYPNVLIDETTQPRRFSELWQYNLTLPDAAAIQAARYWVSRTSTTPTPTAPGDYVNCRGLQLAPDSTLWAAMVYDRRPTPAVPEPVRSAGIVRRPNVVGGGCRFEPEAYPYLPGQVAVSFPNLITNMLYAPAVLNHAVGCADDSVQLWASSAGDPAALRWDFGEPGSGPANAATGRQVAHRYAHGGPYPVRLTLADGRVLTHVVQVPTGAADFTQANVFTPNGDGLNDAFRPLAQPLPGARLRVFSRWGRLVYETRADLPAWDGAGHAAGEYLYQLDYPDCEGRPQQQRGTLTLAR